MQGWQQRLTDEIEQLRDRLRVLEHFTVSLEYKSLSDENRSLLSYQELLMTEYLRVLNKRRVRSKP